MGELEACRQHGGVVSQERGDRAAAARPHIEDTPTAQVVVADQLEDEGYERFTKAAAEA